MIKILCQISLILFLGLYACTDDTQSAALNGSEQDEKEVIDVKDYKEWVSENKASLSVSKELDKVMFRTTYVPASYKYIEEYGDSIKVKPDVYSEFNNKEFYVFTLGLTSGEGDILKSGESKLPHELLLDYLSFRIQNDIQLEVDGKIYPCKLAHFERTYGIKPFFNVNLVFDKPLEQGDRKIIYNDKVFETGVVKLTIAKENIASVPELEMN